MHLPLDGALPGLVYFYNRTSSRAPFLGLGCASFTLASRPPALRTLSRNPARLRPRSCRFCPVAVAR